MERSSGASSHHGRVLGLLSNPSYAGAYVFGRYRGVKSISTDGQIQARVQTTADGLLAGLDPGASSRLHQLGRVLGKPADARAEPDQSIPNSVPAAPRAKAALSCRVCSLCGHCGRRLSPRYTGTEESIRSTNAPVGKQDTRYSSECVRIQADLIDQTVSDRVLEILRPEQVEIAFRAVKELERRSQAVDQQWRHADRAFGISSPIGSAAL